MNVMNNSSGDEEQVECPLCMEPLEVDDLNFYPCTCGYQICRFCWHRIRTDENELCPACRKAYPENPADFTPLSQEQIAAFKAEKRQRDQQRKAKVSENRKHLANVRVVQKNLVFVVGLPPRLADPEILRRHEYFGKYGKIHKVVINPSTTYAGGPSASAYVTYINNNDALKAIQSVNNIMIDGRVIKTSLGTTKYCSHFMKNQSCPKPDCMYLHELGDQEASFTKEEMHQGKHQEYEKRLHDTMQAQLGLTAVNGGVNGTVVTNGSNSGSGGVGNGNGGTGTGTTTNGINANGTSGGGKTGGKENGSRGDRKHEKSRSKGGRKHRGGRDGDRDRDRDRNRSDHHNGKDGHDKHSNSSRSNKDHSTISGASGTANGRASSVASANSGFGSSVVLGVKASAAAIVAGVSAATVVAGVIDPVLKNGADSGDSAREPPSKVQKSLVNGSDSTNNASSSTTTTTTTTTTATTAITIGSAPGNKPMLDDLDDDEDELDFEDLDNDALSSDNEGKTDTPSLSSSGSSHAGGDSGSTLSETPSGKSSPSAFPDPLTTAVNNVITTTSSSSSSSKSSAEELPVSAAAAMTTVPSSPAITNGISSSSSSNFSSLASEDKQQQQSGSTESVISSSSSLSLFGNDGTNMTTTTVTTSTANKQQQQSPNGMNKINSLIDSTTSRFSKLGFFDDNSSFFSHSAFDTYGFNKLDGGVNGNLDNSQSSGLTSSQLPDLLSGTNDTNEQHTKEILKNLGNLQQHQPQHQQQQPHHLLNGIHLQQQLNGLGLGNSNGGVDGLAGLGTSNTDDWEAAFSKYMMRNKMDVEHHEELLRMQELQKRNLINSGLNATQFNGFNGDYSDFFHNTNELNSRLLSQQQLQAHQRLHQQQHPADMNHIYAGNMSKFFDFHKNQQQQAAQQQQSQPPFLQQQHNGHSAALSDPMNIANLLENSRLNSHYLEQHTNGLLGSQLQQKQRMLNGQLNAHSILLNGASPQQQQPQNNRLHNPQQQHQYPPPNPVVDDDLGFDPFFETQKALAELINDEINQQQIGSNNPQQQQQQQQQQPNASPSSSSSSAVAAAVANHKMLENVQRTRMPPPGFNHMNAFGFGVPRAQGSKILPFMNLANNTQQQQQQQQSQQANWGQQLQQQQQQFMGFQQNEQNHLAQSQPQNGHNKAGYGNNFPDWTSFDPAIVSYRQFSFMNGPNQQQQGDLFLTAQQQQQQQNMQQPGQGFGHHGINLQSGLMNQPQPQPGNPQAQVNFSAAAHSWLNSEQSAYMSSLAAVNGFGAGPAATDKFNIPMPPGFQAAAAAAAAAVNKQKAECIN